MAKLLLGGVVGPQGPQGTPGVNGSQGPQGIPGPNEIAATTEVVGLTPGRLLYNNGGKVGSVEIVDDLLSIDPYKPLSANQGKVLKGLIDDNSSAIGQIANERGYVTTVGASDCNLLILNGKYAIYNGLNQPLSGGSTWTVDVSVSGILLSQIAKCVFGAPEGRMFSRLLASDGVTWSAWKEIATTENYTHTVLDNGNTFPYAVGIQFNKVGGSVNISGLIKLGTATKDSIICSNIPSYLRPLSGKGIFCNQNAAQILTPIYISPDGTIRLSVALSVGVDILISGSYAI